MSVKFISKDLRDNRLGNVTFMGVKVTEYLFNDKVVWRYIEPNFKLTGGDDGVSEGKEVILTLAADRMVGGETYPYTITGIDANEVTGGSLKGEFKMTGTGNGTGKITIGILENKVVGDNRIMTITLDDAPHITLDVNIHDETPPPIEGPIGMFYGGSGGTKIVRLSPEGTKKAAETSGGDSNPFLAGAGLTGLAMYYGGSNSTGGNMRVVRIDREGVVMSSDTVSDISRDNLAGVAINGYGVFAGGYDGVLPTNHTSKVNSNGTLVGKAGFLGLKRYAFDGVSVSSGGLFYGGILESGAVTNLTLRLSDHNVSSPSTTLGTARAALAASGSSPGGVFYGGFLGGSSITNKVTIILASGVIHGEEISLGEARVNFAGANIGGVNVFYGGENATVAGIDIVSRFNDEGVSLGVDTFAGTTYMRQHAGAGI